MFEDANAIQGGKLLAGSCFSCDPRVVFALIAGHALGGVGVHQFSEEVLGQTFKKQDKTIHTLRLWPVSRWAS